MHASFGFHLFHSLNVLLNEEIWTVGWIVCTGVPSEKKKTSFLSVHCTYIGEKSFLYISCDFVLSTSLSCMTVVVSPIHMESYFWQRIKKGNYDYLSHNSDFFLAILSLYVKSQNWEIWTQNCKKKVRIARKVWCVRITSYYGGKKTELRDINSELWVYNLQLWDINFYEI